VRGLQRDVAEEFYEREWAKVKGDKYELETKDEMKLRTGFSPDLADWLAIAMEGARRNGFMIESLPEYESKDEDRDDYLRKALTKYMSTVKSRSMSYA